MGRFVSTNVPSEAAEIEEKKLKAIKQRFGREVFMMMDGHTSNWADMESIWTIDTEKLWQKVGTKIVIKICI